MDRNRNAPSEAGSLCRDPDLRKGTSLLVLVGKSHWGRFICIPDIDGGCPLARWDDIFWNTERLSRLMNETDAVTVAQEIKALMPNLRREYG